MEWVRDLVERMNSSASYTNYVIFIMVTLTLCIGTCSLVSMIVKRIIHAMRAHD